MNEHNKTQLESYLASFNDTAWMAELERLAPAVHAVDREAVQIWFRFNSLALFQYFESSEDMELAAKGVAMQGETRAIRRVFPGDRTAVRAATVAEAFALVRGLVNPG
jgi:hypothetical protein